MSAGSSWPKSLTQRLRPCGSPDCEVDGGEGNKGGEGIGEVLVVLCEATVSSEPGEGVSMSTDRGPQIRPQRAPFLRRALPVALAAGKLVWVAQRGRARIGE